jgi:hypothetical protein
MSDECLEFRKIEGRCNELRDWIQHRALHCLTEQKHLEEDSLERGYWAHGYLSALQDVVRLFSRESPSDHDYGTGQRYAA